MDETRNIYSAFNGCLIWNGWRYYTLDWRYGFFGTDGY